MTILEDIFSSTEPTDSVRLLAGGFLAVTSVVGAVINSLNFIALIFYIKNKEGFLKICCLNSFGNCVVCIGYLVWPVPVIFLNDYFLSHWWCAFMGQFIGWFGWSIGPLSQVLLTTNRLFAVFYPELFMAKYRFSPSTIGIIVSILIACFLFGVLLPEGCHYLFNKDYLGWIGEVSPCTENAENIFLTTMISIAIVMTICGISLFHKLVSAEPEHTISNAHLLYRHRRNKKMMLQALAQSGLIITDSLNSTVTYKLFPVLFFQFLTLSFSMVFLRAMEGFIVFKMNDKIKEGVKKVLGFKPSTTVHFVSSSSAPKYSAKM